MHYAQTKDRKQRYKLVFSEVTANWIPKRIKETKTKLYLKASKESNLDLIKVRKHWTKIG